VPRAIDDDENLKFPTDDRPCALALGMRRLDASIRERSRRRAMNASATVGRWTARRE